jgi:magnesium-protoporphyrin IX monomethyl ester (oxidative) cyclase
MEPRRRDDEDGRIEVCLVHMPYSDLEWPGLGLPLLASYLRQRQISTRVFYGSLDFAGAIGLDLFNAISAAPPDSLLGEWTFASAAFPDDAGVEDPYQDWLATQLPVDQRFANLRRLYGEDGGLSVLRAVREATPAFTNALARQVLALEPGIVGCTSMFQQHCASLALLRRIKELSPATVTILGGANCEGSMGEASHRCFPWLDFVMSGEVDAFFAEFCSLILAEGAEAAGRKAPEGVFGPLDRASRRHREAPPRAVLHRLDEAAIPDFDDYFAALAASPVGDRIFPGIVFESSRGCWWGEKNHCTFCGLNDEGLVFRSKSPQRVVDEIIGLWEKYGTGWLVATDAIIDSRHLSTVLPALAAREDRPFLFYEVKANLRREQVQLLSRAGVRTIQPGIESLHDGFLKRIVKGNRWFTNVQLLKWAQEAGITVNWNFLAGAPGEPGRWYDELAGWLPAIYHLEPPGIDALVTIRYDRYSVYHSRPDDFGVSLVPNRAYGLVYPLSREDLADLAYFFEDEHEASTRASLDSEGHRAVERSLREWHRAFRGDPHTAPAQLTAREEADGRLVVRDTRPIRAADGYDFDGLEAAILGVCDTAQTTSSLIARLDGIGHAEPVERIRAAVEGLKELHLLLEWYDRILSLPVCEPVTPYLTPSQRPGVARMIHARPRAAQAS